MLCWWSDLSSSFPSASGEKHTARVCSSFFSFPGIPGGAVGSKHCFASKRAAWMYLHWWQGHFHHALERRGHLHCQTVYTGECHSHRWGNNIWKQPETHRITNERSFQKLSKCWVHTVTASARPLTDIVTAANVVLGDSPVAFPWPLLSDLSLIQAFLEATQLSVYHGENHHQCRQPAPVPGRLVTAKNSIFISLTSRLLPKH